MDNANSHKHDMKGVHSNGAGDTGRNQGNQGNQPTNRQQQQQQSNGASRNRADEELSRLDGRIANQRRRYNGAAETDDEAKRRAARPVQVPSSKRPPATTGIGQAGLRSGQAPVGVAATTAYPKRPPPAASATGRSSMAMAESDILAKAQARNFGPRKPRPGAYSRPSDHRGLEDLEADITAKSRSQNSSSPNAATTQPGMDLAAKAQSYAASIPGAVAHAASAPNVGVHPVRRQLLDLENAMAHKINRGGAPSTLPPSRAQLNQLEQDLMAKETAMLGTNRAVRRSDASTAPSMGAGSAKLSAEELRRHQLLAQTQARARAQSQIPKNAHAASLAAATMPSNATSDKLAAQGIQPEDVIAAVQEKLAAGNGDGGLSAVEATHKGDGFNGTNAAANGGGDPESGNNLAVAVAVNDDASDEFIPAAVEYDPDAKPPIYKTPGFRRYVAIFAVLLIGGIVGIVLGVDWSNSSKAIEDPPTQAPTTYRESLGIQEQLERLVGSEQLNDVDSAYHKAMQWIINEDPLQLTPSDRNLQQRYILALFYLLTSERGEWRSCNPPKEGESNLCSWLTLQFDGSELALPQHRWLSGEPECKWAGIACNELDNVSEISIVKQGISGKVPTELTKLPSLLSIRLAINNLTGSLPKEFGEMKTLFRLDLNTNQLSGTVPESIWTMPSLDRLTLGENNFNGTLPTTISQLSALKSLFLWKNRFSGRIPTEMGLMTNLQFLYLQKNRFVGEIPVELADSGVSSVLLAKNSLVGKIPAELAKSPNIRTMDVSDNQITGTFPEEFYDNPKLIVFHAKDCQLSGTISTRIGEITYLRELHLRDNNLNGTIPTEFGNLAKLEELWLEGNDFTESIPDELCALRTNVDSTITSPLLLYQLKADCLPTESTGDPQIQCPVGCCTECCDAETGDCEPTEG